MTPALKELVAWHKWKEKKGNKQLLPVNFQLFIYLFFQVLTNYEDLKPLPRICDFISTLKSHWQILRWEWWKKSYFRKSLELAGKIQERWPKGGRMAMSAFSLCLPQLPMALRINSRLLSHHKGWFGLPFTLSNRSPSAPPASASLSCLDVLWFVLLPCLCTCCCVAFSPFLCRFCSFFRSL